MSQVHKKLSIIIVYYYYCIILHFSLFFSFVIFLPSGEQMCSKLAIRRGKLCHCIASPCVLQIFCTC